MKSKIMILLFVVSLVAGMIVPATANSEGVDDSGATQTATSGSGADGDASSGAGSAGDATATTDPVATNEATTTSGDNDAGVTNDVWGQNVATSSVTQSQNTGPQDNTAIIQLLGGDGAAGGDSGAATNNVGVDAIGSAGSGATGGKSEAELSAGEIEDNDDVGAEVSDSGNAISGNLLSGNAAASSDADATSGDAGNGGRGGDASYDGTLVQVNANVQIARADLTTNQDLTQRVRVDLDQKSKAETEDLTAVALGLPDASTDNDADSASDTDNDADAESENEIEDSFTFSESEIPF